MNRDALISLVVAGLCVAALGVSATTLDSTMTTEPDEVLDFDYDRLPIGADDAESFKQEVESNREGEQSGSTSGDDEEREADSADEGAEESQSRADEGASEGGSAEDDSSVGGDDSSFGDSSYDRLFDLLRTILELLALLVVLAVVAAVGYRYRHRLRALLAIRLGEDETEPESFESAAWPEVDPTDEIDRAWIGMVRRLDVDRPRSRTPAECADAAVAAGMNADAVRTITRLFEDVHYGDEPVTDERRERARRSAARLDGGGV